MPSLTRVTLVARIGDLVGDPNNQRWSASKKQDKIQEGQERFVIDTRVLVDTSLDSIVAGTAEYALPSDCMDVTRVSINNIKCSRTSEFDLDATSGDDWTDDAGTAVRFYIDLDPNNKKIRFFPIPNSGQAGSSNLKIEYIKIPPTLSTDGDIPFDAHTLLTPYHMAIAYWAAADLLTQTIQASPNAKSVIAQINAYGLEYRKLAADCIDLFRNMKDQKPMRLRGGRYYKGYR